jgi:hypothetical protein
MTYANLFFSKKRGAFLLVFKQKIIIFNKFLDSPGSGKSPLSAPVTAENRKFSYHPAS